MTEKSRFDKRKKIDWLLKIEKKNFCMEKYHKQSQKTMTNWKKYLQHISQIKDQYF